MNCKLHLFNSGNLAVSSWVSPPSTGRGHFNTGNFLNSVILGNFKDYLVLSHSSKSTIIHCLVCSVHHYCCICILVGPVRRLIQSLLFILTRNKFLCHYGCWWQKFRKLFIPSSTIISNPEAGKHIKGPFLYQSHVGSAHTEHLSGVSVASLTRRNCLIIWKFIRQGKCMYFSDHSRVAGL